MLEELKAALQKEEEALAGKHELVRFSSTGPVGINLIKAIIKTIEDQQKEIDELKSHLAAGK